MLVAAEFTFRYFTHGYFPYDLAGSGFVTMAEIEGPEFRPTGDTMYNMDYISHGDSPLTPENWYYQQWESNRVFGSGGSLADIPHLEINITRYLLPAVAERRAWEWRSWGGHEDYQALGARPRSGGDLVLPKRAKSRLLLPYPPERRPRHAGGVRGLQGPDPVSPPVRPNAGHPLTAERRSSL